MFGGLDKHRRAYKVNSLLLFLILLALLAITFLLNIIARRLENMCDLSKENTEIKDDIAKVQNELKKFPPKNKTSTKG